MLGGMIRFFRHRILIEMRRISDWRSQVLMRRQSELWMALQDYLAKSRSTGCNIGDYWMLYKLIRKNRPLEVLECGTGVSTLVIAHALMENEKENGKRGRVTSMEEMNEWLEMARTLLPNRYQSYVDFCLSPTVEDSFSLFRGVRYRDLPERAYDFIFVDGPKYQSPIDSTPTFDFDFLHVLRRAEHPVAGLVDKRVSTCFVLQQILGIDKVRYSPVLGLGFVKPCTKSDLGDLSVELSSVNFADSFRVFSSSRLMLSKPNS